MTMQEVLKAIISEVIHRKLKPEGFKKQGKNFYKPLSQLGWCLDVQSDKWNTKDYVEFTLHAGIFIPLTHELSSMKPSPNFPKEMDCMIRKSISELRGFWAGPLYVINDQTSVE
ncbi:DUF4304 domain-containing protein [Neobacillus sp. CF12]|uniref:DUF4304 domain-containing protein n=1 Tax=Neobacillus sp. CF12 TaxID=3055864 RepID=UPI0025A0CF16|nr:DUF4304 domain-containing protein [Neobacillus sp. CF12]MDM5329964.1 DUF4304 domain-containing protein [Neobacillus sp. CF12]